MKLALLALVAMANVQYVMAAPRALLNAEGDDDDDDDDGSLDRSLKGRGGNAYFGVLMGLTAAFCFCVMVGIVAVARKRLVVNIL